MAKWTIWPAVAVGGAVLAGAAFAQGVQPQLVAGKLQSATDKALTLSSQGLTKTFEVTPKTVIMGSRPGTLKDIKPGSFIGTTNTPTGASSGDSTEVHIFPAGVKMGEGDRPMGGQAAGSRMTNGTVSSAKPAAAPAGGTRMTNGSVGSVAKGSAGITMDVAYAGGTRKVLVTDKTPIVVLTRLKPAALKIGSNVLVGAVPGPGGTQEAQFVNVQP